jgi:hypothetical protein
MSIINVPTCYYEQFDADYNLEVPAEGYGGWEKTLLPLNLEKTALVVMHAWDCGTYEQYPGWYRAVEYIPRSIEIGKTVFPKLLTAVRNSGMKVFHVCAGDNGYYKKYEGYNFAKNLALEFKEETCTSFARKKHVTERDEVFNRLIQFKKELGSHNQPDIERGFDNTDFMQEAKPVGNEGIAEDANQLAALCLYYDVNHLIYVGFAINWCLLLSPGGMFEMSQKGLLCSTIRQAVTAVENKDTARYELCKEIGLWRVSLAFGFVYELDDLIDAL